MNDFVIAEICKNTLEITQVLCDLVQSFKICFILLHMLLFVFIVVTLINAYLQKCFLLSEMKKLFVTRS